MNNYKSLIISSLTDIKNTFPDLTFGEILYEVFRKEYLKEKPEGVSTSWLLEIEDEAFYNAAEKLIKTEENELPE